VTDLQLVDLGAITAFLLVGAYMGRLTHDVIIKALEATQRIKRITITILWRNEP
jgi:hypothetical protein